MLINIKPIVGVGENCPFVKFLSISWYCKIGQSKLIIRKHYRHAWFEITVGHHYGEEIFQISLKNLSSTVMTGCYFEPWTCIYGYF